MIRDVIYDREKKTAMKEEGRPARELQDHFAFILVKDPSVMTKIAQEGVKTKPIAFNALGKKHFLHGQIGKVNLNSCVDKSFFYLSIKNILRIALDLDFSLNSNSYDCIILKVKKKLLSYKKSFKNYMLRSTAFQL